MNGAQATSQSRDSGSIDFAPGSRTSKPVRALIVADKPRANLFLAELRRGGFTPDSECVDSSELTLIALARREWDVILLTNSSPDYRALQELRLLKQAGTESPCIVVSDPIDCEQAVQLMKAGADDVLLMANSNTLAKAVEQAFKVHQERPESFHESTSPYDERLLQLVDHVPHMLWLADSKGSAIYYNHRWVEWLGATAGEGFKANCLDLLHPDDVDRSRAAWELAVQTGAPYRNELRLRRADGDYRWCLAKAAPLRDENGSIQSWIGTTTDIEDLKQAESALRMSELKYRTLIDRIPIPLFVYDRETLRYLAVNDAAVAEYGHSREEFLQMAITDVRPPEDVAALLEMLSNTGNEYHPRGIWRHIKQSRLVDVEIFAHSVDFDGRPACIILAPDITERKLAEAERHRLSSVIEFSPDFIGIADADQNVLFVNHAGQQLVGITNPEVVLRTSIADYLAEGEHERLLNEMIPAVDRDGVWTGELKYRHFETGSEIVLNCTFFALPSTTDATGSHHFACVSQDITEKKQAEAQLRQTTDLLRAVADETSDAVFVKDREGRYLLFNPAAAGFVGRAIEDVLGYDDTRLFGPEDAHRVMSRDRRVMETGQAETAEERLTAAGATRVFLATKAPYRNGQGEIAGVIGVSRDITDRKRAEEVLQLRDRAIQAVTQGIVITDSSVPDEPIIYASPGFQRLTGYSAEEAIGRSSRFLQGAGTDPVAVATIRKALQERRSVTIELLNYRKDGSEFWNELSISPLVDTDGKLTNFVGTMTDVTKRRQLEEQYRQAQKLEAIGQLAGGIAHDFNNLLTVITCYSDMLLTTTDPEDLAHERLSEIKKAGERAAALTRQLLLFSRKEVQSPKVLDLNDIVQRTEKMLARVIGEDIRLVTVLDPQLGYIKADAGQLEQVLLNLTVNARDAMPKGGKLIIETHNAELDESQTASKVGAQPGLYVSLTVTDSGDGIPPEIREHIFEPFFTTKEWGKGTGLGLPVVHSVVKQSGGHIEVVSEPGRGASFKTYFPRIHDEKSAPDPLPAVEVTSTGDEIILLVEDEEAVRGLGRQILSACGYNVLEASNIDEALAVSATCHAPIDLLVTDVVLPGMSGREIAELLQVIYPQMKVLYVSGYLDDAVVRHGISQESTAFLQKPYSQTTLTQKVRDVLDGNSYG